MSADLRLVLTTCAEKALAEEIATVLVEQRLAACVNVLPGMSSTYRWQGKIQTDAEVLLLIKTTAAELTALESTIKSMSGYEVPELVAVDIAGGATDYLNWVAESVGEIRE